MPGSEKSGNRTAQRGKPTRLRRRLPKDAAQTLRLIAWQRYGRPTSDDEEDAVLTQLIFEERDRLTLPQSS